MAIWHRDVWDGIGNAVAEPAMQQLLQRWQALHAESHPELPARDDLLPRNAAALLPRLLWLEHDGQGDFIYRHYGLDIQRHSQFDMTGRRVSEFGGQMGQFFLERYRAVLERRQPLYTVHYADRAASVFTWHRLNLPVQDARGKLWVAVYLQPLESRHELLELVLNRSSDAIAALRPLTDGGRESAHDWLILMANQVFRQLAGCDLDMVSGRQVSDVLPRWPELSLNEHALRVMQTGQSHEFEFELNTGKHWLLWSGWAGPLGDGVVLRLADVTEARRNSFRLYFDHSPDAVLHLAPGGTVLDANPATETLLRLPVRGLISRALASFDCPETQVLAQFVASGEHLLGCHEAELTIPHSDGSSLDVEARLTVYRDFLGNAISSLTVRDISDRRRSEQAIHQLAFFDPLTGVPNRRLLRDRLEQDIRHARRQGLRAAILCVDLDHFKEVNDSLGHAVGDLLLIEAARRMSRHLRESDTLGRMGGDEFTAVLAELTTPDAALRVAEALIASLRQPFQLGGQSLVLGASVGITVFPDDGDDIDTLLRRADQALYLAKGSGRNRAAWFTPDLETQAQQRLKLVNELREAASRGQLSLHYQPIVTLATGNTDRVEALMRWHHPKLGAVSPVDFIPVAESSGADHRTRRLGCSTNHRTAAPTANEYLAAKHQPECFTTPVSC